MALSLPFQQQFTWRKLGYLFYQDSLAYREVLEQNPQWTVTKLPPIGAQIAVEGVGANVGGLTQGNFVFGLPSGPQADEIFPFDTEAAYNEALDKYTLQGVVERETLNGITFDSTQAITGLQYNS